jgi:plastocyanin
VRLVVPTTAGLIAAVAALALCVGAAAGGERAKATKDVEAGGTTLPQNTYFDPKSLAVHKGDKLHFTFKGTFDHDVYLNKAPKGVTKSDYRVGTKHPGDEATSPRFRKPGDYTFYCSFHQSTMKLSLTVKR